MHHELEVSFVDKKLEAVIIVDKFLEDRVSVEGFLKVIGVLLGHLLKECRDNEDLLLVEDLHHFVVAFFSLGFVGGSAFG